MDVPLIVFVAVVLPIHADVMPTPGALKSTHVPKLENDAKASLIVVAPTVSALGALLGDSLQASPALLPAATAKTTPEVMALSTAALSVEEKPPPTLMFATAGSVLFKRTQSTPAMTEPTVPLPAQS